MRVESVVAAEILASHREHRLSGRGRRLIWSDLNESEKAAVSRADLRWADEDQDGDYLR